MPNVAEPIWITIARRYLGLAEGPGQSDNPHVVKFYAEAGHPEIEHDAIPWCAAFVGGVLHEAGIVPSGSLLALSYSRWGQKLEKPLYGCIGAKTRHGGGHVCFILGETPLNYICLGGNQSDRVCIEAIPKSGFVALRWPPNVAVPAQPHPLLTSIPHLVTGLSEA